MGFPCFEIPLQALSQNIGVTLGNTAYIFNVIWRQVPACPEQSGWILDIYDSTGTNLIIGGIPFVTGADLFAQYGYLAIGGGGKLFVQSTNNPDTVPTYTTLGQTSFLFWYPNP